MGWAMGLEPTTSWATTRCSNLLSHAHHPITYVQSGYLILVQAKFCKDKLLHRNVFVTLNPLYSAYIFWPAF